jgi:chitodextrinase
VRALFTSRASDTQAPTTPTGLSARTVSASEIDLTWSPSTDNVRVTAYVIYRNDTKLTTVPSSSYQDTGLAASTAYEYRVQALDAAGNASERSAPRKAKTRSAPDTQPPTTPAGLQATPVSTSEIDLSWSASTDDSGSVAGYVIYRDGQKLTTVSGTTTTYQDTGLTEGTTYTYTVQALDATGNASNQSDPQQAMTKAILK